jgi:hypothetical protein
MTHLYLDTEFNGHGGELLSLALADPMGNHWYGVLQHDVRALHPWVAEHVEPYFDMVPARLRQAHARKGVEHGTLRFDRPYFRNSLIDYLGKRLGEGLTIIADWPADFMHLLELFRGDDYASSWVPNLNMILVNTPPGQPVPEVPHNALSDAIALMELFEKG